MNDRLKTGFLLKQSSFIIGLGSVLNLSGRVCEYNESENPDQLAILNDWRVVGQDIEDSLGKAKKEMRPAA
jgi:hypothetical protein